MYKISKKTVSNGFLSMIQFCQQPLLKKYWIHILHPKRNKSKELRMQAKEKYDQIRD